VDIIPSFLFPVPRRGIIVEITACRRCNSCPKREENGKCLFLSLLLRVWNFYIYQIHVYGIFLPTSFMFRMSCNFESVFSVRTDDSWRKELSVVALNSLSRFLLHLQFTVIVVKEAGQCMASQIIDDL
jgi:hypothetical protein